VNSYSINSHVCTITTAFMLLLSTGVATCSDADESANNTGVNNSDANGPTITLNYDPSKLVKNPSSSFMYFIPLIAPTHVNMDISPDNHQQAWILSYDKKAKKKSFYVTCTFQMQGAGYFKNTLDSDEVIASFREEVKKGAPIKNALDYINFQGEGIGCFEAWGTINDSKETVTEVRVHFNVGGRESPVTIGLYSVDCQNGHYDYSKRHDQLVARAATLTFKKDSSDPKMEVAVSSVNDAADPNGYFGGIVGFFANFFIPPTRISAVGNDTMLNFGYSMCKQQQSFTFPKAANIKPAKPAANK